MASSHRARVLSSALACATFAAAAVAAVPGVAHAAARSVTVRVYDGGGTVLHHQFTANVNTADFTRFAVATEGQNDPGSGEGLVAFDDLVVTDTANAQTTWDFTTPPTIVESTTGNTNDALRHDATGQRLLGVADSGYACSTNYESVALGGPVKKIRFTVRRITGDVGDGSHWSLFAGLVPSDSEPIVGASCSGATGTVDNFAGVVIDGDGDGVRNRLYGLVDGLAASGPYTSAPNTTYVVEVETSTVSNGAPTTPLHFAPSPGQVWRQTQSQVFTIRATDPDANPYTGEVTVRNAATNAVVTTFTTARVSSGASSSGSPSSPLPPGTYKWSAVAYDDFGAVSAPSTATTVRVNTAPGLAVQVNPPAGRTFSSDEAQVFTASATDPDGDQVRALITVKDALTGTAVQTFSTPFGPSGSTLTGQPPSPLPAGTYTWSAQAVDIYADTGPVTGTRPFAVQLASEECGGGTNVADGYVNGTYVRLRYVKADLDTYWVCWRVDNGGAVRNGGRFVVDEADVTGTPSVDTDAAACSASSGNLLPPSSVIRGTVGDPADPAYLAYGADGYLSTGRAEICLSVADATGSLLSRRVRIPVPQATAPAARLVNDSTGTYRPAPVDQPAYPSGDCQGPATGTATELVNAAVTTGSVWLATWQESATRVHVCVRTAGGTNRGGRLTVDTGTAGFSPVLGTSSNTAVCDRSVAAVTSGPAPFAIGRSAATNPGAVCVTVGTTKLAVTAGASGSPLPPSVTWTPDSGIV